MARGKHPGPPDKPPLRPPVPAPVHSGHPRLYENMEAAAQRGDWKAWLHNALETGDPRFWPHIRHFYQEQPGWRWMILFHLRIYWREYEARVAPLFREALRDPEQCEEAMKAAESFPSLSADVVAALRSPDCLRQVGMSMDRDAVAQVVLCLQEHPDEAVALLREALQAPGCSEDPECTGAALSLAAHFPALMDDVVASLKEPEFVRRVGLDPIFGCLACLFGLTDGPADQLHTEWGWQSPLLDEVRAELQRRYGMDLEKLVGSASGNR